MIKNFKIIGTGTAIPKHCIQSDEIDRTMGYEIGYTQKVTGLKQRYYAKTETASDLACKASLIALHNGKIDLNEIDCLIAASGTMQQAIPYNAAFIHQQLNFKKPIPSFDVNMTCLSFLNALNIAASMIHLAEYGKILIVSSDIASVGVNWENIKVGGIFGDGAAAVVLVKSTHSNQGQLASLFETHSAGIKFCQIKGGGTHFHPSKIQEDYTQYGLFEMNGKQVYKLASKQMQPFLNRLLLKANLALSDIDWIVPHQASDAAIKHMVKTLKLAPQRVIDIFAQRGNQVAASLPTALSELICNKPVKLGDKILLIGTSAGLGLGGIIIEY